MRQENLHLSRFCGFFLISRYTLRCSGWTSKDGEPAANLLWDRHGELLYKRYTLLWRAKKRATGDSSPRFLSLIFIYTPSSRGVEVSPYADVPTTDGVPTPVIAAERQLVSRSGIDCSPLSVPSIKRLADRNERNPASRRDPCTTRHNIGMLMPEALQSY